MRCAKRFPKWRCNGDFSNWYTGSAFTAPAPKLEYMLYRLMILPRRRFTMDAAASFDSRKLAWRCVNFANCSNPSVAFTRSRKMSLAVSGSSLRNDVAALAAGLGVFRAMYSACRALARSMSTCCRRLVPPTIHLTARLAICSGMPPRENHYR